MFPGSDDKGLDGKPPEDYSAYDGDQYAGRIRLELQNLKKGSWHWAGARPKPFHGEPIMPHTGYCESAALAAQAVESYWDRSKAANAKKSLPSP